MFIGPSTSLLFIVNYNHLFCFAGLSYNVTLCLGPKNQHGKMLGEMLFDHTYCIDYQHLEYCWVECWVKCCVV